MGNGGKGIKGRWLRKEEEEVNGEDEGEAFYKMLTNYNNKQMTYDCILPTHSPTDSEGIKKEGNIFCGNNVGIIFTWCESMQKSLRGGCSCARC